eukprot:8661179-Lingulodinium_polyedra.AAC.1
MQQETEGDSRVGHKDGFVTTHTSILRVSSDPMASCRYTSSASQGSNNPIWKATNCTAISKTM